MKNILILSALSLLLFSSCSKDDADQPKLSSGCKLTRIDANHQNNSANYFFSYNSDGYVTSMTKSFTDSIGKTLHIKYLFTYNANNQVVLEEVYHTNSKTFNLYKSSETIFQYTNNVLTKTITDDSANDPAYRIIEREYLYDAQGRIETVNFSNWVSRHITESFEYDTNNNLKKITKYENNKITYISEFSNFDNKPNLFATVKGLNRPHDNKIEGLGMLMPNNPGYIKYEWQETNDYGSTAYGTDEILNINYAFGSDGLPTGTSTTNTLFNSVSTSNFTFDCN